MVVRLNGSSDSLTVALITLAYSLFQSVIVLKPAIVSFNSRREYLVCKGLKQRRPELVIRTLIEINGNFLTSQHDSSKENLLFVGCKALIRTLEEENRLLSYISQHNNQLIALES